MLHLDTSPTALAKKMARLRQELGEEDDVIRCKAVHGVTQPCMALMCSALMQYAPITTQAAC